MRAKRASEQAEQRQLTPASECAGGEPVRPGLSCLIVHDMRGLVALLCAVGTAHALGETCSTLWSKLAHLGCRPQDQPLRDHLDTLTHARTRARRAARRATSDDLRRATPPVGSRLRRRSRPRRSVAHSKQDGHARFTNPKEASATFHPRSKLGSIARTPAAGSPACALTSNGRRARATRRRRCRAGRRRRERGRRCRGLPGRIRRAVAVAAWREEAKQHRRSHVGLPRLTDGSLTTQESRDCTLSSSN